MKRPLDHWESQHWGGAMLRASNAVDATAKKPYPGVGVATRFRRPSRDSLDVLRPMSSPCIAYT